MQIAGAREPPGEHRGGPRVQVGLARERGIQRLELLGRLRQQRRSVAARTGGERDLPAQQVGAGLLEFIQRPCRRDGEQLGRRSSAPACRLACAAARARPDRRAGSAVSSTARCKNAAAAAMPPRACARPADRSSSAATFSSGPGAAAARCHARRSGSRSRSVTSASARCAARRSGSDAAEYTADRTSGCRNRTRVPISSNPSAWAATAAEAGIPSRSAARHTSTGSPVGSAAATSSSDRVSAGSASSRRRKPCSIRAGTARPTSPNPPASCAGLSPRGSSSSASGLPFVSATIRSRTCSSSRNPTAERSSARASWSGKPRTSRSASPRNCSPGSRAAKISPTGSASSRRAANASTCADARSSHCASSTTHSSGRSSATSDSKVSTASPTRNRSGAVPCPQPERDPQRVALRTRQPLQPVQQRRAQLMQAGERQLHLRLHPCRPGHPHIRRRPGHVLQQRRLAHPRLTPHHQRPPASRPQIPRADHRAPRALAAGPAAPASAQIAYSCPSPPAISASPPATTARVRRCAFQPTDTGKELSSA